MRTIVFCLFIPLIVVATLATWPRHAHAEELTSKPHFVSLAEMTGTDAEHVDLGWNSLNDSCKAACSCCRRTGDFCTYFGCSSCSAHQARWWARGDYLLWWTKGNRLPPLVTTSPGNTPIPGAGVLGMPGTQILYGNRGIDDQERAGGRLSLGHWFDDCHELGWQASLFSVGDGASADNFSIQSPGDMILARPFFNTERNVQDAFIVAYPNDSAGQIDVLTSSEMHSASLLLRRKWSHGCIGRFDLVGGYRFFRYREGLTIQDTIVPLAFGGTLVIDRFDRFRTENDFHGGEIGLSAEFDRGPWTFDMLAKIALGNVHKAVMVDGRTTVNAVGGPPAVFNRGLLTQPSNIGRRTSNDFGVLPELNLNLRYNATPCLSFLCGYTFLYLNETFRTGDQIDFNVDPRQLPPSAFIGTEPAPFMRTTHLWAQGVNFGVEWRR
jgi:hypothetical protein